MIAVTGTVRPRDGGPNSKLATGEIEVVAQHLEILNKAETPPMLPDEHEAQNINVVDLYPWLMLPVVPVVIIILAFNFFGDGLRDAADPYKT